MFLSKIWFFVIAVVAAVALSFALIMPRPAQRVQEQDVDPERVTVARASVLDRAGRVEELARMLAGERVTETTRRQARELLATPAPGA